jgi:hypothetical protein
MSSAGGSGTAFVISQLGAVGTEIRKRADVVCDLIVKPVADDHDLKVVRSDRDPTPGQVTTRLLRSILDAAVVVADLTGRNPNVFYEVAFAQSFGKATILLVNDPQSLPFDTRNERTIPIGDSDGPITMQMGSDAQVQLREALAVVLAPGYIPSSLITEVAGARSLADLAPSDPIATELASVRDTVEDIRQLIRRSPSAPRGGGQEIMLRFLNRLVSQGRVQPSELMALLTPDTNASFDALLGESGAGELVRKRLPGPPRPAPKRRVKPVSRGAVGTGEAGANETPLSRPPPVPRCWVAPLLVTVQRELEEELFGRADLNLIPPCRRGGARI